MKLFTYQHKNFYHPERLLLADEQYVHSDDIKNFQWMKKQLEIHLNSKLDNYPIWVWPAKPDLRCSGHLSTKTQGVLLTLDVPDHLVLLSDFYAWHSVLNNGFLELVENEEETLSGTAQELQIIKEKSWLRCFDLESIKNCHLWYKANQKQVLQGVIPYIEPQFIIGIKYFVAK